MSTFVIVHGGWGGGWEWEQVADLLRRAGHRVHTPTLTGLGDRAHLGGPEVGLGTHVQDVVATIETLDLHDVVLAGQSYGGVVVAGVLDRVPERIATVAYVDAFLPEHGESCNDLFGPGLREELRRLADEHGDGWAVPLPFEGNMGLPDDVAEWYVPRLTPQPFATFDEPADLSRGGGTDVRKVYLKLTGPDGMEDGDPLAGSAARARAAGYAYREVVGPHDMHVSAPEVMTSLLLDVAAG